MPQEPLTQLGQRAPNWDQTGKYWELESPSCQVAAGRFAKLEARGQGWGGSVGAQRTLSQALTLLPSQERGL